MIPDVNRSGVDSAVIKYNVMGNTLATASGGYAAGARLFIPGYGGNLINTSGPNIVAYYSSAVFKPGCTIRWEPSVSFSTSGRVYVGFVDNPEVVVTILGLINSIVDATTYNAYADAVKGLGSVVSFPIWQETDIQMPMRLRRKRFDVDTSLVADTNNMDRSTQTAMFAAIEGTGGVVQAGLFSYHDVVDVEGLKGGTQ